ncbi:acetate--CoA ligase family protein [Epibacterium ulvae]|uniref:acetate--CoA ligase family protein n=1 Tax=Epibacterium ulvae TaxID=1156985 RepID=UPI002491904B|nr:acetate--CoA ligase family protein [Epibacterium ulvae]
MQALNRLFCPKSIAVIGGGTWCASVIEQCRAMGFQGEIWPVHPSAEQVAGLPAFRSVTDLPDAPDAAFVGVNRTGTLDIVAGLAACGAGGAVCFASGFLEAEVEDDTARNLNAQLLEAAGDMPFLGPNCYGFINYLDGALLWPDQHGGVRVDRGVAIVTQSSNIALNLTMQQRGVPLAYVVTAGNQAQTGIAEIATALLEDPRVTALGLHIEGFGDLRAFEALAARARDLGKRIVALKVGRSHEAKAATLSHTASLAGGDAGAAAFLTRLGIARLPDLSSFLETLKLLHITGALPSGQIRCMSCSGGEASLVADAALGLDLSFPALSADQATALGGVLGQAVTVSNPLDYHTSIWRNEAAMTQCFATMMAPDAAITLLVLDVPRLDRCDPEDWHITLAALKAAKETVPGAHVGVVSTLPELMVEHVAQDLIAAGIVPFAGIEAALTACEAASVLLRDIPDPVLLPTPQVGADLVPEADAKARLAAFGLRVPLARRALSPGAARAVAADIGFPVVLKGEGIAHKTEAGAVVLNLQEGLSVREAADAMPCSRYLVEEMITGVAAELLIGVVKDPAHGFVLTLAAGGTLTELWQDQASLLLPVADDMIEQALSSLRIAPLLDGYRGAPAADRGAILRAIRSVEAYVLAEAEGLDEIEINPLLCTATDAVAADALLRRKD